MSLFHAAPLRRLPRAKMRAKSERLLHAAAAWSNMRIDAWHLLAAQCISYFLPRHALGGTSSFVYEIPPCITCLLNSPWHRHERVFCVSISSTSDSLLRVRLLHSAYVRLTFHDTHLLHTSQALSRRPMRLATLVYLCIRIQYALTCSSRAP